MTHGRHQLGGTRRSHLSAINALELDLDGGHAAVCNEFVQPTTICVFT